VSLKTEKVHETTRNYLPVYSGKAGELKTSEKKGFLRKEEIELEESWKKKKFTQKKKGSSHLKEKQRKALHRKGGSSSSWRWKKALIIRKKREQASTKELATECSLKKEGDPTGKKKNIGAISGECVGKSPRSKRGNAKRLKGGGQT